MMEKESEGVRRADGIVDLSLLKSAVLRYGRDDYGVTLALNRSGRASFSCRNLAGTYVVCGSFRGVFEFFVMQDTSVTSFRGCIL